MGQIVIVNAIMISGEKTRFRFDLLYTEIEVIDNTRYKNPLRSSPISSLRTSTVHRCLDKARDCGRTILPPCSRALRFATRTGSPALVWRSSIRTAIRVIGGSRNIGSNSNRTIEHRAVFDLSRDDSFETTPSTRSKIRSNDNRGCSLSQRTQRFDTNFPEPLRM